MKCHGHVAASKSPENKVLTVVILYLHMHSFEALFLCMQLRRYTECQMHFQGRTKRNHLRKTPAARVQNISLGNFLPTGNSLTAYHFCFSFSPESLWTMCQVNSACSYISALFYTSYLRLLKDQNWFTSGQPAILITPVIRHYTDIINNVFSPLNLYSSQGSQM